MNWSYIVVMASSKNGPSGSLAARFKSACGPLLCWLSGGVCVNSIKSALRVCLLRFGHNVLVVGSSVILSLGDHLLG